MSVVSPSRRAALAALEEDPRFLLKSIAAVLKPRAASA